MYGTINLPDVIMYLDRFKEQTEKRLEEFWCKYSKIGRNIVKNVDLY